MKKTNSLVAATLFVALSVAAPAAHAEVPEVPVTLSGNSSIAGDALTITGHTSIPDGAWLIFAAYSVEHPLVRTRDYMLVKDGQFSAQVDISGWPSGEIETDIHFQTMLPDHEQPAIVMQKYGAKGERMSGDTVVQEGESYRAAVIEVRSVKP